MASNIVSKNTYTGINPKVVKHLQCQSQRLKPDKAFANEDIEDIEQNLLLDCLPLLREYDELDENYEAFVGQLIKRRASNLRKRHLCKKRAIDFVDEADLGALGEEDKSFEHDSAVRIDVNEAIANLSSELGELGKICKLLMEHNCNVSEVSRRTGVPSSTIHDKLKKLRENKYFTNLKIYLPVSGGKI